MFRTALRRLARLSVGGVRVNYDIDATPEVLYRANLPALLILPIDTFDGDDPFFSDRGPGLQTLGFSAGASGVIYTVTHLLLVAPAASGTGARDHLPELIDLIDAYFHQLARDVTLRGALLEPARVRVEPGVFGYGGTEYYGCAFRHTWLVGV